MPRRPRRRKQPQLTALVALVVVSLLAPFVPPLATPRPASAATASRRPVPVVTRSQSASMSVTLTKPSPSVSPTGTLQVKVAGSVAVRVDTLTVRLRVRRPSGKLLYQKTAERYSVKASKFEIDFSRPLKGLELKEGRYALEAYITADRLPPVTLTDRLYVLKPGRKPVPLVVVARFNYVPMMDPDGRFVIDPATTTRTRDEVSALGGMLGRSPWLKLSLGIPPLMLDEWRRITAGYQLVQPEGVGQVRKDAPVVATYAAALGSLGRTVRDPRVQLLDVPYADPDLAGLRSIGAMEDLKRQYERGFSVYRASLGATPSAGSASLGDSVPLIALPTIAGTGIEHVLLKPSALAVTGETTPPPGVYAVRRSKLRALVMDSQAAVLLDDRSASVDDLLDHLFARLTSTAPGQPVVANVHLGPGSRTDVASVERTLVELQRTGWVRFETAAAAAKRKPAGTGALRPVPYPGRPAPKGYWQDVSAARSYAYAFIDAVSERDEDAVRALYAAFVAESRYWAGTDNSWSFADRGRAFADSALRSSRDVLDKVSVTTQTITLSGTAGKIPISIKNGSGKTLNVAVVATAANARFPSGARITAILRPADNYVTVPVDLGAGSLTEQVRLTVMAGDVPLAETTVDVHASYLDRLALVALVVVVLVGLLFYIRHKVRNGSADT